MNPRHEAMTSEQIRSITLYALVGLAWLLGSVGCEAWPGYTGGGQVLEAPYGERQLWAVAPLRNETGSRYAESLVMADELTRVFEQIQGIDALPVNRVLKTMDKIGLAAVQSREDAMHLREALGVDVLIVGAMTHYDAYDPPKLGLALDLYSKPVGLSPTPLDIRGLAWAPTSDQAGIRRQTRYHRGQPVTTVSGYFDADALGTKALLDRYAYGRGTTPNALHQRRLHVINMNLFQRFVSHEMGSQMIWAEWQRLAREIRQVYRQDAEAQPQSNTP